MLEQFKTAVDITNGILRDSITTARDASKLLANLDVEGAQDAQLAKCLQELGDKTKVIRAGLNNAQTASDFLILVNDKIKQLEQSGSLPFSDAPGSLEGAELEPAGDGGEEDADATAEELRAADAAPGAVKDPGAVTIKP